MTVATDLQLATGVQRRVVLRIDGLNYDFWQAHDVAAPTAGTNGWRAPLECLEVAGENSAGLDLPKQRVSLGSLEFKLRNIYTSAGVKTHAVNAANTTYLLAQLFAQGRWSTGAVAHLRKAASETYLLPSATTVTSTDNTSFPSSGVAHIGRYAFSYSNTGGTAAKSTFTGVSFGVYPAFGTDSFATAIRIDPNDEAGHVAGSAVTEYPQSMMGRRVGLYVVTLGHDGAWPAFSVAELLWAGMIDIDASYVSSEGCFSISCSSILSALDNDSTGGVATVGRQLPQGGLTGICIGVDEDITWQLYSLDVGDANWDLIGTATVTISSGQYASHEALALAVSAEFAASAPGGYQTLLGLSLADGTYTASLNDVSSDTRNVTIRSGCIHSHVLHALGLPQEFECGDTVGNYVCSQPPFESYSPLGLRDNGGYLYTTLPQAISSQGSAGTTDRAYVLLSQAWAGALRESGESTGANAWVAAYSSATIVSSNGTTSMRLTLADYQPTYARSSGHAGTRLGGDPCEVRTVVMFDDRFDESSGPFTALLPTLLSCGDQDGSYNGAYDEAAPELGIGVQDVLVDTQSFIAADAAISGEPLAAREQYIVTQSEKPWMDLLQRECLLFGFFLAFSRGQLRMKRSLTPDANLYTETLTADSGAQLIERPDLTGNMATVVNAWQVRPFYDAVKDEIDKRSITCNDSDSRETLGVTKSIKIEHPGLIPPGKQGADGWLVAALEALFSQGAVRPTLGWPLQRVDVSLGPKYVTRVGIGDVVRYQNDNHPDPFGSGSMSTDALALVTDLAWDYSTWTARASLAIYARGDLLSVTPWAPAAIVRGWVGSPGYYLTLTAHVFGDSATDSEDGSVFVSGDIIQLRWTHPTDPASGETLGPYTVDAYDSSTNRLSLSGTPSITLTATREYVATPADWTAVQASQQAGGLFQASTSHKISTDEAQRYG